MRRPSLIEARQLCVVQVILIRRLGADYSSMTPQPGSPEKGRNVVINPVGAARARESSILINDIVEGFTGHPLSTTTLPYKSPQLHSAIGHSTRFTPLHFSHIRHTGCSQLSIMPSTQSNYMSPVDPLSLSRIRSNLIRLEDTIIFCECMSGSRVFLVLSLLPALIERAQFALNPRIYQRDCFDELKAMNWDGSWLEWFLKETETFHGEHAALSFPLQ